MDARPPATNIPGYSRAGLKRMIAAGNVAALGVGVWIIFFPTHLYALALSFCVLLPLWALALDMRTQGALGFEERRGRRYSRDNYRAARGCARSTRGYRSLTFRTARP